MSAGVPNILKSLQVSLIIFSSSNDAFKHFQGKVDRKWQEVIIFDYLTYFWCLNVFKVKCLHQKRKACTELSLNCSRATAQQTHRCQALIRTSGLFWILHLTFVPSIPYSSARPKPPSLTFSLPRTNRSWSEWCLLYLMPLPSLWGRAHFDRSVFMAYWSHVGMNHEKDQNHLGGCSFLLSAGQLCGSSCVAYVRIGLAVRAYMCSVGTLR